MNDAQLGRAHALLAANRPAEALGVVTRCLATEPDNTEALGLLAQAHHAMEQPAEMLRAALALVAREPEGEWGHRLASIAYGDLGQRDAAVRAAIESVRLAPELYSTHLQYAIAAVRFPALRQDAYRAALRATELHPFSADAHFVLAICAERIGRHGEVRGHYAEALRLDPQHASAHNNLTALDSGPTVGLVRQARGYAEALRSDPSHSTALENLHWLAYRFSRHLYWAALATLIVCVIISATDGPGRVRNLVGALLLTGLAGYAAVLARQVPVGVRRYVTSQVARDAYLACTFLLSLLMIGAAATAAFAPAWDVEQTPGILRLLGFLNVGLLVWSVTRRKESDFEG